MLSTQLLDEPAHREVDAGTMASMLASAADLTLVLGPDNRITGVFQTLRDLPAERVDGWRGREMADVVRRESLAALDEMLVSARVGKSARRFEITHPIGSGRDLPIQYSALPAGGRGELVLVGRDLRTVAELQSRLHASRRSLEENTERQRRAEAHYRLLFETAAEAIVIVEPDTGRIREANPRATEMLSPGSRSALAGRKLANLFEKSRQGDVQAMIAGVFHAGAPATLTVETEADGPPATLAAELFRAGDLKLVLLRVTLPVLRGNATQDPLSEESLGDIVRNAAEAVLLADPDGKVVWVNESFLGLAGLPLATNAVGRPLEAFFEWQGIDQDVLLANVRMNGRVSFFEGIVRGANGLTTEVELSAVALRDGPRQGTAFVMRARTPEDAKPLRSANDLTRTAENLVEMIGRVPMKDMVRDTTDVIERMCIEAALKLSGNNRALTARVLGLSRQALYLKMRRFGIADEE